jgi:hypothetical protein
VHCSGLSPDLFPGWLAQKNNNRSTVLVHRVVDRPQAKMARLAF